MAINVNELFGILDVMPAKQNIMLVGKHGIGKSEILTDYFHKLGIPVVTLFLGQMSDPGDLIGLPRLDEQTGKTVFIPPYWFPVDGNPVVLFLDELNRARPEVLQTIMDLALNRKLAGRTLPAGSRLISAVNDGDEYQLTDLDPALVSRFNIFEFCPSTSDWLIWAQKKNLDNRVVAFIRKYPKFLDGNDVTTKSDMGLEKTPDRRAWEKVSDCIANIEEITELHKKMIAGIVGPIATQAFTQSLFSDKILSGGDILLNYKKHKEKLKKYQLHEIAIVNEDVFRFLETDESVADKIMTIAVNLTSYINDLQNANRNEEIAHFASFFENENYPKAVTFIVTNASEVYGKLIKFIESL